MRIAIVTFEFEGLTKNGGIGTAYRLLAENLRAEHHDVTVVFMPFRWQEKYAADSERIDSELASFKRQKIKIVFPELESQIGEFAYESYHLRRSYAVYKFLRSQKFDVVHAPDNAALLYVTTQAKNAGLDFQQTRLVLGTHGSMFWTGEANGSFSENSVLLSRLDEISLQSADTIVSPSAYMLRYLNERGVTLPNQTLVIPNVNRLGRLPIKRPRKSSKMNRAFNQEIVFFGRLERRKGLYLFLEALEIFLEKTKESGRSTPVPVTFLGSVALAGSSESFIKTLKARLSKFGSEVSLKFLTSLSSSESQVYLSTGAEKLVCMPSLLDNSPYVVVEAIQHGLNFITTSAGGQSELIDPIDHEAVLCEPTPESFAKRMCERWNKAPVRVRPSILVRNAGKLWREFHREKPQFKAFSKLRKMPKVSIVLGVNARSPAFTAQSTLSLNQQTYSNIELIHAKATLGMEQILRSCSGDYILFLENAKFSNPRALQTWVRATLTLEKRSSDSMLGSHCLLKRRSAYRDEIESVFPLPSDPLRLIAGQSICSSFVLWKATKLKTLVERFSFDVTDDLTLRPFIALAATKGLEVQSIPFEGLYGFLPAPDMRVDLANQNPSIWNSWDLSEIDLGRSRALIAGLYRDLALVQQDLHNERAKNAELQLALKKDATSIFQRERYRDEVLEAIQEKLISILPSRDRA